MEFSSYIKSAYYTFSKASPERSEMVRYLDSILKLTLKLILRKVLTAGRKEH